MIQDLYNHGVVQQPTLPIVSPTWSRHVEWLAMPSVAPSEKKVVILARVDPGTSNFYAFTFTITGGYTVDWGDGTSANFASGVTAYKQYDYTAVANSPISDGYKQVMITITPQNTANNFSNIALNVKHNQSGLPSTPAIGYQDVIISAPGCATITVGTGGGVCNSLERVQIISSALTSLASICSGLSNLRSAGIASSATVTSFASLFLSCSNLVEITALPSTAAVTNINSMYAGCRLITNVPAMSFPSTFFDATGAFSGCYSLRVGPQITFPSTGAGWSGNTLFANCFSLVSIPSYDFSRCTNFSSAMQSCYMLQKFPASNFTLNTTFGNAFQNCYGLQSVGTLTTSNSLTSCQSMFQQCYNLLNGVELTNTSQVSQFGFMYWNCFSLAYCPTYDTSAATTFTNMFYFCQNLREIPPFSNTALVNNFSSAFFGCHLIRSLPAFNYTSCTTINSMCINCFNLQSVNGTITLSSAATTITLTSAFQGCSSLITAPTIVLNNNNTSVVAGNVFASCTRIITGPSINLSKATSSVSTIVNGCTSMKSFSPNGVVFGLNNANGMMSTPALVALFNSLGTASGAQTLTVSGNWGWASLTTEEKAIATNKGWTLA